MKNTTCGQHDCRPVLAFAALLCSCLTNLAAQPVTVQNRLQTEAKQVQQAREILDSWSATDPELSSRTLKIITWKPQDRSFPADDQQRLTGILQHIQAFYAREMARHGWGPRTLQLDLDNNNSIRLIRVNGLHNTSHYGKESGREIRQECLVELKKIGIEADQETLVIFCHLADWDPAALIFTHRSPYYAGGSARSGTAWQLDSPELSISNMRLKLPIISDSQYGKISLGKHNSIFIGGIAHELGHALGLPHCSARPDEQPYGTALMGSGNRTYGDELRGEGQGTFLSFAHALRLASHPQFSGSIKELQENPRCIVSQLSIAADKKSILISGSIKGTPPLYGLIAYFDPVGNGDYDSTTATAVPAADGTFELQTAALSAGKAGEIRLVPLHVNGMVSTQAEQYGLQYSFQVAKNGQPDVSSAQTQLQLIPFAKAWKSGQQQQARELAAGPLTPIAARLTDNFLNQPQVWETSSDVPAKIKTLPVGYLQPVAAKVGWLKPTYNQVPDDKLFLQVAGQFFETGIYAHAPARHLYSLEQGWKQFHGQVGLATGHNGSVQFEILADGRSLWKSNVVKTGQLVPFAVDVNGIKNLELLTYPTADGAGADWGVWLEPTLSR